MYQDITITFVFIIACFSLIISIGQLFVSARRLENYNLAIIFCCTSILLLQGCLLLSDLIFDYPNLLFPFLTLSSLLGPLLYYAYFFLCLPEVRPSKITTLLFLPALFMLVVELGYLFSAHETKIVILRYIYKSEPAPHGLIIHVVFIFPYLGNTICHTLSLLKLISARRSAKDHKIIDVSIMHIVIGYVITVMFFFAYLLRSMVVLKYSIIAFSLSTLGSFLINQRYPEYLQLVIMRTVSRYTRSKLSSIDAEAVGKQLIELMENEKAFADEDLSLNRLAYELSITPHQLSEFLNEKLNSNFNSFINHYRVDEAKKMLIDEPDRPVMSICHGVGFNSKSAFYRAFEQLTGMTLSNIERNSYQKKGHRLLQRGTGLPASECPSKKVSNYNSQLQDVEF